MSPHRLIAPYFGVLLALIIASSPLLPAGAAAATVSVSEGSLLRNGKPYLVKGAGGYGPLKTLKKTGGNSVRSWGVHKTTGQVLDYTNSIGLTMAQGLWMAPARDFDYSNHKKSKRQLDRVLFQVNQFKSHPAILVWGVGNEVELGAEHDVDMWKALNQTALEIKKIDPKHPTMIVLADFGHNNYKLDYVKKYCPDVDIIGVNTYGGALSVSKRYVSSGLTKPMLVTEFGAVEKSRAPWGATIERTSTEKSEFIKKAYQSFSDNPYYAGSYAFLWGSKREKTETFYGLFLEDGRRTQAVETLYNVWRRKRSNRCPHINELSPRFHEAKVGGQLRVKHNISARYKKGLKFNWRLSKELKQTYAGKEAKRLKPLKLKVLHNNQLETSLELPKTGGRYRLYLSVTDKKKCTATASIPLLITP